MITGTSVPEQPDGAAQYALMPYSQRDPRWARAVIAGRSTFASSGCYITCIAMLASLAGYTDTPPQVLRRLREAGAMSGAFLANPGAIPNAYPGLCWCGRVDWPRLLTDAELEWYLRQVLRGPVITRVRRGKTDHFVLAVGVTSSDVMIIDPLDGEKRPLLPTYGTEPGGFHRHVWGVRLVRVERLMYGG